MTVGASLQPATVGLEGISKRFGATQALDGVSLELLPAEAHALVGENGAGKSTLVKILAGVYQPDSGQIELDGTPVQIHGPAHARELGIAVIHQEPRLFPDLTVAENVFLGHQPTTRIGGIDWKTMRRETARLFDELEVAIAADAPVRGLSMADQQLVEIAKALSLDARVLIMDEPTASLSLHEVERLFSIVRPLRDRGLAVLFVSHRLEEVFDLCERATVLRDGAHVITAPTSQLTTADLIRHMVGRDVTLFPPAATAPPAPASFEISASACAPARSSALPAWLALAAPKWPECCSGSTRRRAGKCACEGDRSHSSRRHRRSARASRTCRRTAISKALSSIFQSRPT